MKRILRILGPMTLALALSASLSAQPFSGRYDDTIQSRATQQLAGKKQFKDVQASVDDGIVTLTGNVQLYQQKLDAAKRVKKLDHVNGVRNHIEVASTAGDTQLEAQLGRKLHYDRIGYDNLFNYIGVSVKDGVATLSGETRSDVGHDSALSLVAGTPGVKDIVDNVKVAPVSLFDDGIRLRATRAIYGDTLLGRYASDPALPIRIVVHNGHLTLYGTVENQMDKNVAGLRAGQVTGVFSVDNQLVVNNQS